MPIWGWIRRVSQSVDQAIDSLENRDDVVRAVITESENAEKLVREELAQMQAQVRATECAMARAQDDAKTWRDKARTVGHSDRQSALTFLHRKNRCEERAAELRRWLADTQSREQALVHQIEQIRHRTRALEQTHSLLRSRERTARTYEELSRQSGQTKQTEALLGRWKSKLENQEIRSFGHSVVETELGEVLAISSFEEDELVRELENLLEEDQ